MGSKRGRAEICPQCRRVQAARNRTCSGCGHDLDTPAPAPAPAAGPAARLPSAWREALASERTVSGPRWAFDAALLAVMAWVTITYLGAGLQRSQRALSLAHQLLESANLVFHEAGHWILAVLRVEILTVAGGSLLQLAIPALCAWAFLRRHPDAFAATFATWWAGQSAVDLAPYVADARVQQLILLGGVTGRDRPGYHDWNNLLGRLGLLEWDRTFAWMLHAGGMACMAAALAIGAGVLVARRSSAAPDRFTPAEEVPPRRA